MNINWKKDDQDNSISLFITDGKTKLGLHFEDTLKESCFTYSGDEEIWAGMIPLEFMLELEKHLGERL